MTIAVAPDIRTFPGKPSTLVEILHHAAEKHHRPKAFSFKQAGNWVGLSYQDVARRARHVALGLHKIGVRHSDRVGLLAESRIDWIVADLGTLAAGAADVPLYATLTAKQSAYILNDSGAQVLFISTEQQLKKMLDFLGELPQ